MAFSISGNVGVPGVLVVLGVTSTSSTTSDGSGNYTFSGLAAGQYIVFPQLYGYSFSPVNTVQTIVGSNLTNVNFTATLSPTPVGVWNKHSSPIISNFAFEPCVIYEGNAQILSGNVFKMLYLGTVYASASIYYAESVDGINWTQWHANPVINNAHSGRVFKHNGTYYGYYNPLNFTEFDRYTSSDGVTWTKTNSSVLTTGPAGAWDDSQIYNMQIAQVDNNGTWWAVYGGNRQENILCTGVATSPDGITWTKLGSNPVMQNFTSTNVQSINGAWWAWGDITQYIISASENSSYPFEFPTILGRSSSVDLINWTAPVQSLAPSQLWETDGSGLASPGTWQLDSPAVVGVGNKTYMFYGATNTQGGTAQGQIGVAIASGPISSVVGVAAEGVIGPGVSRVQEVHTYAFGVGPAVLIFPQNVTAGDLLIVWIENQGGGAAAPTDTASDNWTKLTNVAAGYGQPVAYIAIANTTGPLTITIGSAGNNNVVAQAVEYSGSLIGVFGWQVATGTSAGPQENIFVQTGNLVFGICAVAGGDTLTPAAGWLYVDGSVAGTNYGAIYTIPVASAIQTPQWVQSSSAEWGVISAVFGSTLPAFPLPQNGFGNSAWLTVDLNNSLRGLRH